MKKMRLMKIIVFIGVIACLGISLGYSFNFRWLQTHWFEAKSPLGKWTLSGSYQAPWGFRGVHTIYVYGRKSEALTNSLLFKTTLENEGSGLAERNYLLIWEGETAVLTLRGHDQPDTTYQINVNNPVPYLLVSP